MKFNVELFVRLSMKLNFAIEQAMKAHRGSREIAILFLNLDKSQLGSGFPEVCLDNSVTIPCTLLATSILYNGYRAFPGGKAAEA